MAGAHGVHQLEDPPAAARNAGERIIRHHDRQAGLFGEELINITQQRAAAGQDDAAIGDVSA